MWTYSVAGKTLVPARTNLFYTRLLSLSLSLSAAAAADMCTYTAEGVLIYIIYRVHSIYIYYILYFVFYTVYTVYVSTMCCTYMMI